VLNAIADAIEKNLEMLAVAESWENGKPVRETLAADIPLGRPLPLLRRRGARRGGALDRDRQGPGRLPLPGAARCGRSDHPVQLPAADGGVEDRAGAGGGQLHGDQAGLADALVDPEADAETIEDVSAAGRDQHRHRSRARRSARRWRRTRGSPRSSFTGETVTGRLIMQYAAQNLIPSTVELGGKSPNIFFAT
jgi:aldehyde dehydrogenase